MNLSSTISKKTIKSHTSLNMSQLKTNTLSTWFRSNALKIGFIFGVIIGVSLSAGAGFLYLQFSQDSVSVKNGQLALSKVTNTDNTVASNGGVSNSGNNSTVSRDNSSNNTNTVGSPQIKGNYNTINIVSNRELPGFSSQGYSTPPPELSNYTQGSDFQSNELLAGSSAGNINFAKQEIVVQGKQYHSYFFVDNNANLSRYVFNLDGTQKAALIQFAIPDLTAGNISLGSYTVNIYSDGKKLWSGGCQRQGSQIVSAVLPIPDVKLLTIEVTSNRQNDTPLYFTQAQLLK